MSSFFDSDIKSQAWTDIAHGNVRAVKESLADDPCYALMRAADGRGAPAERAMRAPAWSRATLAPEIPSPVLKTTVCVRSTCSLVGVC